MLVIFVKGYAKYLNNNKENAIFLIQKTNKQLAWVLLDDLYGTEFYLKWQNDYMDFPQIEIYDSTDDELEENSDNMVGHEENWSESQDDDDENDDDEMEEDVDNERS